MSTKEQLKIKIDHLTDEQLAVVEAMINSWEEEPLPQEQQAIDRWNSLSEEEKGEERVPFDQAPKELGHG